MEIFLQVVGICSLAFTVSISLIILLSGDKPSYYDFHDYYEKKHQVLLTNSDKRTIDKNLNDFFYNDIIMDMKLLNDYKEFIFKEENNVL